MSDLTDLEKTRLCAKASDIQVYEHDGYLWGYLGGLEGEMPFAPLNNSAQAEALDSVILRVGATIEITEKIFYVYPSPSYLMQADMILPENRRRARVECVAKMMKEKT